MASSKLSALADLAGGQVPTDLAYIDEVSAGAAGSKKSTLNDLFAIITKNITDLTLAFQDGAAGAVSAASQGKLRYNDTASAFQVSINTAAYVSLATSANNLGFFAATTSAQLRGVISDETGSGALVFADTPTLVTPTIASFTNATHNHENAGGGGQLNASNVFSAGTVPLARGGTGASLADPGANKLLGWDDTDNAVLFITIGSNLSYDHATHTLSATGGGGTPGGADTQIQYNNAGAFGGVSGFTSNGTNVTAGSGNLRATRPQFTTSIDDSNGNELFVLTATGSAVNEFTVANAATGGNPTISTSGGDSNIPFVVSPKGTARFESTGPLRLSGSGSDTFTTPGGSGIPTKINIPLYNPGAFGQILAIGLDSGATSSARCITLLDQRSTGHQLTLMVLSPDENQLLGLTWDGSNNIAQLSTTQDLRLTAGTRIFQKAPASAPTDGDIPNSYISFWLDEGSNLLTVRVRYSGGTLKTGTVALT
jgi:hypothetical protein